MARAFCVELCVPLVSERFGARFLSLGARALYGVLPDIVSGVEVFRLARSDSVTVAHEVRGLNSSAPVRR